MSASSSWFSQSNIFSNLSTSIIQATSKVSHAVQNLVQSDEQTTGTNKDLSTIFTDLGSTVVKGAQQLKQVVEEKSFLGQFTKEHDKFLTEKRTQQRREEIAVPPWIGYNEEDEMKQQILALSKEKSHFLRSPPEGANYHFDMATMYPVALATLEIDENLKQMRFNLVPKQVKEEDFWKNYFYRVSLIKQATQLKTLTNQTPNDSQSVPVRHSSELHDNISDINEEFISEDCDTSILNTDEVRREIEQFSTGKKLADKDLDENEWDEALLDELENVPVDEFKNMSAEEFDAQLKEMLPEDMK